MVKGWSIALIGILLILLVIVAANLPSFDNPQNKPVYTVAFHNELHFNSLTSCWVGHTIGCWEWKNFAYSKTQSFDMPMFSITSPTEKEVTVACWMVRNSDGARSSTKSISLGEFNEVAGDKRNADFLFTGVPEGDYTVYYSANRGYVKLLDTSQSVIISATVPEIPKTCGIGDIGCYLKDILAPIANFFIVMGVIAIGILLVILFIVVIAIRGGRR